MFSLFTHTETFTIRVNPDKLMEVMSAHTRVKDRFKEKIFEGTIEDRKFDVNRYHQPIMFDLNVTRMKGIVQNDDGYTKLKLTYSLNLLHKLTLIVISIFFTGFVVLLKVLDNENEVTSLALGGLLCVVGFAVFYHLRFKKDTKVYKKLIRKIVVRSSAEYAAGVG